VPLRIRGWPPKCSFRVSVIAVGVLSSAAALSTNQCSCKSSILLLAALLGFFFFFWLLYLFVPPVKVGFFLPWPSFVLSLEVMSSNEKKIVPRPTSQQQQLLSRHCI